MRSRPTACNSGKMQVELIEMPDGSLTADAGNRVDLSLR